MHMPAPASLTQFILLSLLLILPAQTPPQGTAQTSEALRVHLKQEQLYCFALHFVPPTYPREARLAHTEGVVKLNVVFADDSSIADLQGVSGEPLLMESAMKAVRQWRLNSLGRVVGGPKRETEVALSFTFKIEDPPKPAYLHLSNGKVIRANSVREFTDGIEYNVGHRTHRISADSVKEINACARIGHLSQWKEGDCVAGGGPFFVITAIPLLPGKRL
jgi:Gram-negative bacterial TonB protein C-terminal